MRVLITGGAGFIGQHLARALPDHDLVALDSLHPQVHEDREASRARFPGLVVEGDVADRDAWHQVGVVDHVVHLAAETGTGQSMYERDRYERVNVGGTEQALAYAAEHGVPLVSMSSRAVYGNGRHACPDHGTTFGDPCCARSVPEASRETDPGRPVSVYGETKLRGERVLSGAPVPVTVIRPQNVIGAGQALHNPYTGVLAAFLARLREGRSLTVYGDGSQTRDFVHVTDLCALIVWALHHPGDDSVRVLNCGSGVRTTLLELARYAAAGAGRPDTPIEHLDVTRAGDIEHACADLDELRRLEAPLARWTTADAVADFITSSWEQPGAPSEAWESALAELAERGLTRGTDG